MSAASRIHADEPHVGGVNQRLNWLRAGVLGANDGIVSVAAIVGGAVSMALGEYVSVSSQRDTERALIEKERRELAEMPEQELDELTQLYRDRGLSDATARQVAVELTAHDALAAHLEVELGINQDDLVNPWHAALSSAVAFTAGAILPMLAILLPPPAWRIPVTFVAVLAALAVTGTLAAHLGDAPKTRAAVRLVIGGALALVATWAIGRLLGTAGVAG